jgi:hypothetical protein
MTQALLLMDIQNGTVERFDAGDEYLDRVVAAQAKADICLDDDDEVHRVLTHKVFPRQADVISSSDWRPAAA